MTEFRSVTFSTAPEFYDATFDRSTTFSGCTFASLHKDNAVEAVNAYRYLKRAMNDAGADLDESRFYSQEQKALLWTADLSIIEKALSMLYWLCADYGHRVGRPLTIFLLLNLLFIGIYVWILPIGEAPAVSIALQFGIEQIVRPFSVWVSNYDSPYLGLTTLAAVRFTATIQSLSSLSLIGLFFVSLHRHFRMR